MELICNREPELLREPRHLPGEVYNTAYLLLKRSKDGVVFVPIRNMLYLAIIDQEEIIFLANEQKNWVAIAWQNFAPQHRNALAQPVAYEAVYYTTEAQQIMPRLQHEFPLALRALANKNLPNIPAHVIQFSRNTPD